MGGGVGCVGGGLAFGCSESEFDSGDFASSDERSTQHGLVKNRSRSAPQVKVCSCQTRLVLVN